ncbi:MAG TPA: ACP S-malonyltransferase [Candidatus Competibacter sp.]|nr:ACP S-malonyltransferase [Candidatus Competibacter sp.]
MAMAWVFPGQGSQYPGMGRELFRRSAIAREWLAIAEELSRQPLAELARRGPLADLTRPRVLEPLLTALNGAYVDYLREQGLCPACVAGYSAGEVAALYAADVLDRCQALQVAVLRGDILERRATALDGGMVALYGVAAAALERLVNEQRDSGSVAVGARNGRRHLTVTGARPAVAAVERRALAIGAFSAAIDAAGPWHCQLLADASQELLERLRAIPFRSPRLPVFVCATGNAVASPQALKTHLAVQLSRPIQWNAVVRKMLERGVRLFLEVGPGRVLNGLLSQQDLPAGVRRQFLERPDGATRAFRPDFLAGLGDRRPAQMRFA